VKPTRDRPPNLTNCTKIRALECWHCFNLAQVIKIAAALNDRTLVLGVVAAVRNIANYRLSELDRIIAKGNAK
jgi:hypothetical protein